VAKPTLMPANIRVNESYYDYALRMCEENAVLQEKLAALQSQATAVRDGWTLVPINPTMGMLEAINGKPGKSSKRDLQRYEALLAATPALTQDLEDKSEATELASKAGEWVDQLIEEMLEGDHPDNSILLGKVSSGSDDIQIQLIVTRNQFDFLDEY
jgi:hypothetical protein